jgi:ferredoxin
MPVVEFRGREIECERGAVLRRVLLEAGESPHNGRSARLNCRGHGTCGTCAVAIRPADRGDGTAAGGDDADRTEAVEGGVDANPPVNDVGVRERTRLSVPPHDPSSGLRLACRTRVYGDIAVTKHAGFWGQHVAEEASDG